MATPHIDAFIDAAYYFIGLKEAGGDNKFRDPRAKEMKALAGFPGYEGPWCACMVSACVTKAGAQDIIKRSCSTSEILRESAKMGAEIIPGPYINGGVAVTPQRGDIITFGNSSYHGTTKGCHIGIVEYADDKVHTIEGNSSDQCKQNTFALDYKKINAYIRPNWAALGDDINGGDAITQEVTVGPLYTTRNDRHDMTMRQVGYLDSNYRLSNSSSGIAISIINYTSVLGDIYDMLAPASVGAVQVDTSQLDGNVKIAMDYYLGLGFSASAASALVGCLTTYSRLHPELIQKLDDKTFLYGIGAWEQQRLGILRGRSDSNWNTNLSAQLAYFNYDLYQNYSTVYSVLKTQPTDSSELPQLVETIMSAYNPHFTDSASIRQAIEYANATYSKLIITMAEVVGDTTTYRDISGNVLSAQYSVEIPSYVPQTGIIDDYTSYSHWYSKWNKRSPQKKLANLWGEQGFCCDRGIATIGGYYCAAVRPKFGRCGELIEVTLEDNTTFPIIICDEKGEDAGSEWGHVKSGGNISLVEWERVKTSNGRVITSGTTAAGVDPKGFDDWWKKKVIRITNYGTYISVGWS